MELLYLLILIIFLIFSYNLIKKYWNNTQNTNYNNYINGGIVIPFFLQIPFMFFLFYKLVSGSSTGIISYFLIQKLIVIMGFVIVVLIYRKQINQVPSLLFYLLLGTLYLHIVWIESFIKLESVFFNITISILILIIGYIIYLLFLWKRFYLTKKEEQGIQKVFFKNLYFYWICFSFIFSFFMSILSNGELYLGIFVFGYQIVLFSVLLKQKQYVMSFIVLIGSLLLQLFLFSIIYIIDQNAYLYKYINENNEFLSKILLYILLLLFLFILTFKKGTKLIRIVNGVIILLLSLFSFKFFLVNHIFIYLT